MTLSAPPEEPVKPAMRRSQVWLRRALLAIAIVSLTAFALLFTLQRRLIYHPTVVSESAALDLAAVAGAEPWRTGSTLHGWRFPRADASAVLLVFHGNAGMALRGTYIAQSFGRLADDSLPHGRFEVRVVEYPGFGARPGAPSETSFFSAAEAAFDAAVAEDPARPVFALGESIGTGSACHLAEVRKERLAGVILITPFDRLENPASVHYPWLPVSLFLRDRFENDRALAEFHGPVAFLLAGEDTIVPTRFGAALYNGYSGPKKLLVEREAGHNTLPWNHAPQSGGEPVWREIAAFVRRR